MLAGGELGVAANFEAAFGIVCSLCKYSSVLLELVVDD